MKLKRIALLLASVMLLTILSGTYVMASGEGSGNQKKYEILCGLGFFDESVKFAENASVTRGEVAKALVNAMPEDKIPTLGAGTDTGFSDVSANDPIAELAFATSELNILGEQEEFKASVNASTEDALFMLLNMLGYNSVVGDNFSAFAASIGLTKGVADSAKCSIGSLVSMIYNAIDTEILQQVYEKGGLGKRTVPGETYMSEVLEIRKLRGQVTAGKNAAVMGENPTYKNSVIINGTEYLNGNVAADGYLGCVVDFYYRVDDENDHKILYMEIADEKDVLHIDADKIRKFENMTYTYEPGESVNRKKTARISVETEIIYNGKNLIDAPVNFKPEDGYVRLIDNDGDKTYEIAIIMDYVSVTVSRTDLETGEIYDFYYPERVYKIDLYDDVVNYDIKTANGSYARFGDITKMDTIFVAESQDKELVTIIVSRNSITGTVSTYSDEEIVIDGFSYEPSENLRKKSNVKMRSYGIFRLDPAGRVASYESMGDLGVKAGYATKIIYDPDVDGVMITMFTEDGNYVRLYTTEKLYYVDGREAKPERIQAPDPETMVDTLNGAKDAEIGGGLFMLYKLNMDGEIKEIEIPAAYTTELKRSEYLNDNEVFRKYTPKKRVTYNGWFDHSHRVGDDTKVFFIPADISNKDGYSVFTGKTNLFKSNTPETSVSYMKNTDSAYAEYVLGFVSGSTGTYDSNNVFLVEAVNNSLDSDDEIVQTITGKWGGADAEFQIDKALGVQNIKSGDILRLGLDNQKRAISLSKIVDYEKMSLGQNGGPGAEYGHYIGYAYDFMDTTLRICYKNPETLTLVTELQNVWADSVGSVYEYDHNTKKFTATSYSKIKTYKSFGGAYSKIFAHMRYSTVKTMVIYE